MSAVVDPYRLHMVVDLNEQHDRVVDDLSPFCCELDVQEDATYTVGE